MYFADWMKATDLFDLFADFYADVLLQLGHGPLHGVGVDTGLGRQLPHSGQTAAGGIFAIQNQQGDLLCQLLPDGAIFCKMPG